MDNDYSTPRAMKRLGDLFEKYQNRFKAPQATVEKECLLVIEEVTGFALTANQVTYVVSTRTISLHVPSLLKTELKFHFPAILQKLEERLGKDGSPQFIR